MYKIALNMLFGDTHKYVTMVVGMAIATLIMTHQSTILIGILSRTLSLIHASSLPDIWVMDSDTHFTEGNKLIKETMLWRVRGIDNIKWAVPLYVGVVNIKLSNGSIRTAHIIGIDDATLIGAPAQLFHANLRDIKRPNTIFVDKASAYTRFCVQTTQKMDKRPLSIGDIIEINDNQAHVIGYFTPTSNFILQPHIYTTYTRALSYALLTKKDMSYILVKVKKEDNLKETCKRIETKTNLKALTSEDFITLNLNYWIDNTGIPIHFGVSLLFGFIIGSIIMVNVFSRFIKENMKYYATFKVMGIQNKMLAKFIMVQICIVCLIGYGVGLGITYLYTTRFHVSHMAEYMPPMLLLYSGLGVLLIASITILISLKKINNNELLRVCKSY